MDPATIAGLVASAVGIAATIGHVGNKIYKRIEEFKDKSDSVPEVFETICVNLPLLLADLRKYSSQIEYENPSPEVLVASGNLVKRLKSLLNDLDDKLNVLIPSDQDSKTVRVRKAFKSIGVEAEANRIWGQICESRNSLTFDRVVAWGSNEAQRRWAPPILEIPQGRQVEFIGRQQILSKIAGDLSTVDGFVPPTVVLRGMGGQGKTQLALQFCIQNRDRAGQNHETSKKYHAIFWVDATSETAARRSFLRIYERVKAPGTALNDEDAQIQHAKQTIQGWTFPWLIVFDNYDKPSEFSSIRDYMPIGHDGAVLVTSRHEDSTRVGKVIDVPALSQDEAVELLLKQIRDKNGTPPMEAAKLAEKIVMKLGCHALAVHQAGCFIDKKGTLADFLSQYDKERAIVMSWTPTIWSYVKPVPGDHKQQIAVNIFTAFQMAFDAMTYEGTDPGRVRRFLEICSHLSINRIPDTLFLTSVSDEIPVLDLFRKPDGSWNQKEFQTIIRGLREYGLVLPSTPVGSSFAIHPLISDWLKIKEVDNKEALRAMQLEDGVLAARIVQNSLLALAQGLPHRYLDLSLDIRQEILPHVLACKDVVSWSSDTKDALKVHSICETFAEFLDSCGIYDSAQKIQEAAVKALKSGPDPHSGKLTSSIGLLARIYHHKGMYMKAEVLLLERICAVNDALEIGDPGTLALAELLTGTLCCQRKFDEAEKCAATILDIRTKYRPDDQRKLLKCKGDLVWIWQHNHKMEKAEAEGEAVLNKRLVSFGRDDLDTLSSYNSQGCICLAQGKLDAAEGFLRKSVDGRTKRLGREHPSTLNTLTNLSMVFASQERWEEAISQSKEILQAREAQLGESHIATLVSVANLLEILKYAPMNLVNRDEALRLRVWLDEAAKRGLWEWTMPGGSCPPVGKSRTAMSEKKRFEYRELMRYMGSIWRSSSPRQELRRSALNPAQGQRREYKSFEQQQQ
ncbi:hypothetical protein FALCPG4_014980 [Fusarium falciforme]